VCENSFLDESLPHARRLGAGVDDGREVDQPVDELGAGGALADKLARDLEITETPG